MTMTDHKVERENENEIIDTHDLIEQRRAKLTEWRVSGKAFPTDFRRNALAAELIKQYSEKTETELEAHPIVVSIAGRIMIQINGQSKFYPYTGYVHAAAYIRQKITPEMEEFKQWILGIIGTEGHLFKPNRRIICQSNTAFTNQSPSSFAR